MDAGSKISVTSGKRPQRTGIFLNGGGARGPYQAGYLEGLRRKTAHTGRIPFDVVTGVSAGALNAMALAVHADDFDAATRLGSDLWHRITFDQVFVTKTLPLLKRAGSLGVDFTKRLFRIDLLMRSLGINVDGAGKSSGSVFQSLLDCSPLKTYVERNVDFDRIRYNIAQGHLRAIGVSTFNYSTGKTTTFFEGHPSIHEWERRNHVGIRTQLNADHILASCALPLFFAPVVIGGDEHCDGGKENKSPLSPAVFLGADRILAINNSIPGDPDGRPYLRLSFGAILSSLIGSAFSDHVILQSEEISALNRGLPPGFRPIEVSMVSPSRDLYQEALAVADECLPWTIRFLLGPWGGPEAMGSTLSTFLFHPKHTARVYDIGLADANGDPQNLTAKAPEPAIDFSL